MHIVWLVNSDLVPPCYPSRMDIFAAVMGLLCFFCGMTNGFAGIFGVKDSPKENAGRLSAFMIIAAVGFVMLAVMAP